ncbi:MAG: cytochrome b562 [Enterovibrio sp.]
MFKQLRPLVLSIALGLVVPSIAFASANYDELEEPMKALGSLYKKADRAKSNTDMAASLKEMKAQMELSKQKNVPAAKKEKFMVGMDQVIAEIDSAIAALDAGDQAKARMHMQKIDSLKKEYHKYAAKK